MMVQDYSIQELCEKSGIPRRTIHFYTQQGVLPPPSGAGLGARYDEEHLYRLFLIPLLRNQGLRLDDIRKEFQEMDVESLKIRFEKLSQEVELPPQLPKGQTYLHYELPDGMFLVVPTVISQTQRQKLQQLLQEAGKIFS